MSVFFSSGNRTGKKTKSAVNPMIESSSVLARWGVKGRESAVLIQTPKGQSRELKRPHNTRIME